MHLSPFQTLLTIFAVALGVQITRFAPFLLFSNGKKRPAVIDDLGKALPPAMIGLLVVYCLRGTVLTVNPYGIPEMVAMCGIIFLHYWKGNALLSIGLGTALYMLLLHFI